MDLKNKETYENLISLLQKSLEFYSNVENYSCSNCGGTGFSPIELDSGENASFALKQVETILKTIDTLDNDLDSLLKSVENREIDGQEILKELNRIANGKIGD